MRVGNNAHVHHHEPRQPEVAAARAKEHPGIVNKGQNFLNRARNEGRNEENALYRKYVSTAQDIDHTVRAVKSHDVSAADGIANVEQQGQAAIDQIKAEVAETKQSLRQDLKGFLKSLTKAGALPDTIQKIKESFKRTVIRPLNFAMRNRETQIAGRTDAAARYLQDLSDKGY